MYYTDLLDLFHEVVSDQPLALIVSVRFVLKQVTYQTEIGQTLDLLTSPDDKVDFSRFSLERYRSGCGN